MTREEIIQGLQFTIDMFLFEPTTGETHTEPRNDMDKTTIDACKGAISLLSQTIQLDSIKEERYNQGFFDGFRKATQMANNCIEKIKEEIKNCITFDSNLELTKTTLHITLVSQNEVLAIIDRHTKGNKKW